MANRFDLSFPLEVTSSLFKTEIENGFGLLSRLQRKSSPLDQYSWFNETLTLATFAITGLVTDGDGTQFDFASTTGLLVNQVVTITDTSASTDVQEQMKVSVIDSGTRATFIRDLSGTTGFTLAIGDVLTVRETLYTDGADIVNSAYLQPSEVLNRYTTIQKQIQLSGSMIATATDDGVNSLNAQMLRQTALAARELGSVVIRSRILNDTTNDWSRMDGYVGLIEGSASALAAGATAISSVHLDNMMSNIIGNGGTVETPIIVAAPNQIKKIRKFENFDTLQTSNEAGRFVDIYRFNTTTGGRQWAELIEDPNLLETQAIVGDMSKLSLITKTGRDWRTEALAKTGDSSKALLLGEFSFECLSSDVGHSLGTGFTV